jgi:hypothetical protein
MLNVNIFGSYDFRDLPTIPVVDVGEEVIVQTLQAFVAEEQAALDLLLGQLATFDNTFQESFGGFQGGTLQPAGEHAIAEATREGAKFTVNFPLRAWEDRKIYTVEFLKRASLANINKDAVGAVLKDVNTVFAYVFGAITNKDSYIHDTDVWPDVKKGQITVRKLANNDGQVGYTYVNGAQIPLATSNHYITSGAAAFNLGAFTTARDKLRLVGHAGNLVHVVSQNDGQAIPGLLGANFVPRPDPALSILPTTQVPLLESPRAIGRIVGAGEVQVWPHWPDGYMLTFDRNGEKPIRIRQSEFADERGFQLVADETRGGERAGHPLVNKFWRRIMGAGIYNRWNGVMTQITAAGAYTNPAGPA